jgi:hypothetical protein
MSPTNNRDGAALPLVKDEPRRRSPEHVSSALILYHTYFEYPPIRHGTDVALDMDSGIQLLSRE